MCDYDSYRTNEVEVLCKKTSRSVSLPVAQNCSKDCLVFFFRSVSLPVVQNCFKDCLVFFFRKKCKSYFFHFRKGA